MQVKNKYIATSAKLIFKGKSGNEVGQKIGRILQ